ncbi:MAG: hypothetical protein ABSF47_01455 [Minisyncoccia bacterium]
MKDIHPGTLVWWDEQIGVLAFTEIGKAQFKLLSLRDFRERTFAPTAGISVLKDSDFILMRPATIEEARESIRRREEEFSSEVRGKQNELDAVKGRLDAYHERAKTFLKGREAESVPSAS